MAGTVTVACKIPNGLELRAMESYEWHEPVMGGGTRPVTLFRQKGDSVVVKGPAAPEGVGIVNPGGYHMTSGIDADFWAAWLEQNKDTPLVKSHMVYALAREDSAISKGRELADTKSGMERLDPSNLPNVRVAGLTVQTAS